jgi:pimeloyl-ACP methyl ester carboxylesterase
VEGDRLSATPCVVFVPGLLCDRQLWQPQLDALAGCAETWVADVTRDDSVAGMAARVLGESPFQRFALAGLSMGGYVAMEMMRQAPQRVTRLALLDTQARADTPEAIGRRLALIELTKRGRFAAVPDRLLPLFLHASRLNDPRVTGIVRSMASNVGEAAFVRQQHAIMHRPDSRESLRRIACPTLVLCGEHDLLTPLDRHEEMTQLIRGAILVAVRGSGHLPTIEKPEETSRALARWLELS